MQPQELLQQLKQEIAEHGIIRRKANIDAIISLLEQQSAELHELRAWKASAMQVMPDFQTIGKLIGVPLGQSVHDKIIPYLQQQQEKKELMKEIITFTRDMLVIVDYMDSTKAHVRELITKYNQLTK